MPEKFNIVRQCRHGLMVFNRHDQFIGKALKVYGEYSEGEYDVFSQVVKPGDTVIEAGANLGAHTLWDWRSWQGRMAGSMPLSPSG